MKMTAAEIGIANAKCAFDFRFDYASLQDSIDNFYENIPDTLADEGMLSDANLRAALDAFDAHVAKILAAK